MAGKEKELVTIVSPIHNSQMWLDEAILSVRAQTFENFRYILVNDNSIDDSLDIAYSHAREDDRLSVLNVAFNSVSLSRQAGIAQTASEFIAFLDGDDTWHQDFLAKTLEAFDVDTIGVYSLFRFVDEHGKQLHLLPDPSMGSRSLLMTGRVAFEDYLLADAPAQTASGVVVRAGALTGCGFRQDTEPCEDYWLWLDILSRHPDKTFYGVPEPLVNYRVHGAQQSGDTQRVFTVLDRLFVTYVPRLRDPALRWQVYEYAGSAAQRRGLQKYADHFWSVGRRLSENPDANPTLIHEFRTQ